MIPKESGLTLVLAVVAGLVGGTVSGRFMGGDPVIAQEAPKRVEVVRAEQFQVVDRNGVLRAQWGTRSDGTTSLVFGHKEGEPRAALVTMPDGSAALGLVGPDGKSTSLTWDAGGRMGLVMFDKSKSIRAELYIAPDGSPGLVFYDKDGKTVYKAP